MVFYNSIFAIARAQRALGGDGDRQGALERRDLGVSRFVAVVVQRQQKVIRLHGHDVLFRQRFLDVQARVVKRGLTALVRGELDEIDDDFVEGDVRYIEKI